MTLIHFLIKIHFNNQPTLYKVNGVSETCDFSMQQSSIEVAWLGFEIFEAQLIGIYNKLDFFGNNGAHLNGICTS
jgi:hypothetical protein